MKFIFALNAFSNTYGGGLSSYGLSLLYLAYLGFKNPEQVEENRGSILFDFIEFIGCEFSV